MSLVKEKVIPVIEKIFDQFDTAETIRIDQLKLELNDLDLNNLEANIIRQVKRLIPTEINHLIEQGKGIKTKTNVTQTLGYFLKTGILPWWEEKKSIDDFEKKILEGLKKESKGIVQIIIDADALTLDRLVFQFSDDFFQQLINFEKHSVSFQQIIAQLRAELSRHFSPRLVRNQIWKSVVREIFVENSSSKNLEWNVVLNVLTNISKRVNLPVRSIIKKIKSALKEKKSEASQLFINVLKNIPPNEQPLKTKVLRASTLSENKNNTITTDSEYFIQNAGLIILHPFVAFLFQHLEYTKDNKFIDKFHQQQAALLLQYLLTDNPKNPEYNLVLNKVLCGIELTQAIESNLILNEEIKTQSKQLLHSTIKHWSALGNTSPAGLQNSFLKRDGKLSKKENGDWKLFIQHKTEDILISKLPWNISMIKFPWMNQILWVDWA